MVYAYFQHFWAVPMQSPVRRNTRLLLQAVPVAESFTRGQLQPLARDFADQAVPTAKEFTEGQLHPAAKFVAEIVRFG